MALANRILAVNGGSSSVKFALFESADPPRRLLVGEVDRLAPGGDPSDAADDLIRQLDAAGERSALSAIGHRVVHGGPKHFEPTRVDAALVADLRAAVPLDPAHLPAEIRLIELLGERFPGVPQVACFDTAFHRDLPTRARMLAIPRRYFDAGVRRYGFHGLSYEHLMAELERDHPALAAGRVVLAHLGSGASLAAVRGGQCIDTTMGFTPAGGLVMGTRCGDLDPGVLIHLARRESLTADRLDDLVNRESGLLGVSETSADVRDLLARRATDPRAAEAVELFCYQARKFVGAMAATLGGLDALVFTGGVGEHSEQVRAEICDGLEFLNVRLDADANAGNRTNISAPGCAAVLVVPADEESAIARAMYRLLEFAP